MQDLISGKVLTMSSREIAELSGKLHKNVTPVIFSLRDAGLLTAEIQPLEFKHNGNTYTEYQLNKRDSILLIARLSPEFTARLVDRWQELENNQPSQNPMAMLNDPSAMRAMLLNYTEQVLELKPKADAFDSITNSEGELCLTDAAKYLHIPPRKFNQFLQSQKWIFKRNGSGSWTGYQRRIEQGFLTHKRVTYTRNSGETEVVWQPLVTPEGIKALSLYPTIQEMQSK